MFKNVNKEITKKEAIKFIKEQKDIIEKDIKNLKELHVGVSDEVLRWVEIYDLVIESLKAYYK